MLFQHREPPVRDCRFTTQHSLSTSGISTPRRWGNASGDHNASNCDCNRFPPPLICGLLERPVMTTSIVVTTVALADSDPLDRVFVTDTTGRSIRLATPPYLWMMYQDVDTPSERSTTAYSQATQPTANDGSATLTTLLLFVLQSAERPLSHSW